ncbi:MAG: 16S rRNA (cytosine(967)-C(5))-methyltransferase RsmB [Desulfobacula sp.]|nr:16S rRNA (cytosine(967)-C(5))-methyltransferase RsmB [Desulfobacula sp.]
MSNDPRQLALTLFLSWESSLRTLDQCLEKLHNELSGLPIKDRRLFNAVVFGVFRHRDSLDFVISAFSHVPLKKIKLPALYLLRSSLFQIIYLDKIPDFAAIDTSVAIAKKTGGKQMAGFINAILRKAAKNHTKIPFPKKDIQQAKHINATYSIPPWLIKKWIHAYGFKQTSRLCHQINTIPSITLRTNIKKTNRDELKSKLAPFCRHLEKTDHASQGLRFTNPVLPIHEMDAFKKGLFQIQDEAAQLVSEILDPQPLETILDACAGLGTKTCHIAQLMKNKGKITALDIGKEKLSALLLEARRLGFNIIEIQILNLLESSIKDFSTYFDRVLLDAPCSGLGVLRRNPDTKYRRTKKDILRLSARQKKMLNAASNLVRQGGTLVYAVCSCEKEENEDVIFSFLKKRKDFSIDKEFRFDAVSKSETVAKLVSEDGFFKTYPQINNMDGFFAARLKRKQN